MSEGPTADGGTWHSWDEAPWAHPWLRRENLERVRDFSRDFFRALEARRESRAQRLIRGIRGRRGRRYAFCGNVANCMYTRARPLREKGHAIDLFLHPDARDVFSQPGWEEYEGCLPTGSQGLDDLGGLELEWYSWVHQYPSTNAFIEEVQAAGGNGRGARATRRRAPFLPREAVSEFPGYLSYIESYRALQEYDSLWCTQCVYFGYLSGRPYIASQMGGDLWFDASRGDEFGVLMRRSFERANVCVFSNPWSLAHARRYGFRHFVYLPKILDQRQYAPGEGKNRRQWEAESGGDFFVLTSSRLDKKNKGSAMALEGFAAFAGKNPGARLVLIGWGNDREEAKEAVRELGIEDRVILLPLAGKERIRDYLRSCDVFLDQFVLGYFGGAGLEAMACGVPVIGRIETDQYEALCETGAPPIRNAGDAGQIEDELSRLAGDPEWREDVARDHRRWFLENHGSDRWEDEHVNLLRAVAEGESFDFAGSPLNAPVTEEEREHHAEGMRRAPPHPHYHW